MGSMHKKLVLHPQVWWSSQGESCESELWAEIATLLMERHLVEKNNWWTNYGYENYLIIF